MDVSNQDIDPSNNLKKLGSKGVGVGKRKTLKGMSKDFSGRVLENGNPIVEGMMARLNTGKSNLLMVPTTRGTSLSKND